MAPGSQTHLGNLQLNGERAKCTKQLRWGSHQMGAGLALEGPEQKHQVLSQGTKLLRNGLLTTQLHLLPIFSLVQLVHFQEIFFPQEPQHCCHSSWNSSAGSWPRQVVSEHMPLLLLRQELGQPCSEPGWLLQGCSLGSKGSNDS